VVDFCVTGRREGHATPGEPDRYPATGLPDFLQDRCTPEQYRKWLNERAEQLFLKDLKRKRPCARGSGTPQYRRLIHEAVVRGGRSDPFTGDALAWELIGTWDPVVEKAHDRDTIEKFALLPSVDHIDPYSNTLAFELCSFDINKCKSDLNPEQFIALCAKINGYTPP
jgi:hypothetical protein